MLLLPLITSPYISRVLGADGIGTYSYTYSIVNYFVIFAKLGIDNYGNRTIAKVRDNKEKLDKTFSSIFYMHIIISLIVCILYFVYVIFLSGEYFKYALIQSIYIIAVVIDINWLFFGLEEFKITVTRNTCIKIMTVLCIFIFIKDESDIYKYLWILSLGSLISQSIVWIFVRKHVSFVRFEWDDVKQHFKPMFKLFIPAIAVSLYKIMDKIMLGSISGTVQVGYYENAEKIINTCIGVIIAFGNVMLPRMSNLTQKGDIRQVEKYINISMQLIMFISIAMAFGLAGISKEFTTIFFGIGFEECIILIVGLSITLPFMGFANVLRTQYLIPNCWDKVYIVSVFGGAIINIMLNIIFISRLNALGAVIGTIFAEICVCIIQAIAVRKKLPIILYVRNSIIHVFVGMCMYIIVKLIGIKLGVHVSTLFIQILIGAITYISLHIPYYIITKNEICRSIFSKYFKNYRFSKIKL